MEIDPHRQASDAIKDLMVHEKRSRLGLVIKILVMLGLVGGVVYWFYLPPAERPDLKGRVMALSNKILNAPIINGSTPAPNTPSPSQKTSTPSSPSSDASGLLSN